MKHHYSGENGRRFWAKVRKAKGKDAVGLIDMATRLMEIEAALIRWIEYLERKGKI